MILSSIRGSISRRCSALAVLALSCCWSAWVPALVAVDPLKDGVAAERLPPLFAYTQRTEVDGIPVLTLPIRKAGNKIDTIVEVLAGTDYVFRFNGARVSRSHFQIYVEGQTSFPVLICADGQLPDANWLGLFSDRVYVILLRRETLACRFAREPKKPLPPELGYLVAGGKSMEPAVIRVRATEKRDSLPSEELAGAKETPEGRERYTLKPAATRVPLKGLTAKTVKGAAVDLDQLAKTADKPIPVALVREGEELDKFWLPVLKPDAVVIQGLAPDPERRK